MNRRSIIAVGMGLWAPFLGCHRSRVETADVRMTWSIDGVDSPERCAAHRAALIEITISDPSGRHVDTVLHRCFVAQAIDSLDRSYIAEGARVTLPTDREYLASARLKDANGDAITTAVTATLSPNPAEPGAEPNFEFGGTFINGTSAPR